MYAWIPQPKLLRFILWARDRLLAYATVHPVQCLSVADTSLQSSLPCLLGVWPSAGASSLWPAPSSKNPHWLECGISVKDTWRTKEMGRQFTFSDLRAISYKILEIPWKRRMEQWWIEWADKSLTARLAKSDGQVVLCMFKPLQEKLVRNSWIPMWE